MSNKQLSLFDIDDEQSIFSLLNDEFLPNEYFEIEYKSGKEGFPKELWKSYSAFANTNTGIIVIGVKRKVDTSNRKVDTPILAADSQSHRGDRVDTSIQKVDTLENKGAPRLTKKELELLIMKVCLNDYLKMEEVAIQIGKSVDYLKNKIFPVMIKDGKLIKRFPYTHNHPDQGYKTSEEYAKK